MVTLPITLTLPVKQKGKQEGRKEGVASPPSYPKSVRQIGGLLTTEITVCTQTPLSLKMADC